MNKSGKANEDISFVLFIFYCFRQVPIGGYR